MADMDNMNMDIELRASGVDTTTQQFNSLAKTIERVTEQVGKLSSRITVLMRNFSRLNNVTAKSKSSAGTKKKQKISPIVKKRDNRLNLGDLANIETGEITNKIYKLPSTYAKEAQSRLKQLNEQLKNTGDETSNTSEKFSSFISKFQKLVAVISVAKKLANTISVVAEESGSWIENLNLFSVTFGESNYREVLDWANDYAKTLGIANNEIVKMAGYFKQLSTAIGITGDDGTQLSQIITQLGYDFGSFYNIGFEEIFEKLQAGIFSGQVRTLRSIGIDVSQAAIENLLATNDVLKGLNASSSQLTQTQKVLARTILTLQAGTNAYGDLARSIDTLQNRQRVLIASFENLKLALGDLFAEPVREFMAYAIAITKTITSIIRMIKPLQTELSYDVGDTIFTEIKDEAEATADSINQLPFDKWQSLTSGNNEQINLTEALNELLREQISNYSTISSQFDGIDERVQSIQNSIMGWIFPNKTLEEISSLINSLGDGANLTEKFGIVIKNLNPTLRAIVNTVKNLWGIVSQIIEIINPFIPAFSTIATFLFQIVNTIASVVKTLHLIYPVLVAIIALKVVSHISTLVEKFSNLGKAFTNVKAWFERYNLQCELATKRTDIFKQSIGALSVGVVSIISAVTSLVINWEKMSTTAKVLTGVVTALTATFAGLAVAKYAALGNWAKALSVAGVIVAAGATVVTALSGFENGGIPAKSELFYMNENGIPEALINTGGSETNVINIEQLSEGMRRGFVQAIYETGLNKQGDITIKLSGDINDSAFARAIFPALKTESKRRGGNQL